MILAVVVGWLELEGASVRRVNVLPAVVFSRHHVVHRGHFRHALHSNAMKAAV